MYVKIKFVVIVCVVVCLKVFVYCPLRNFCMLCLCLIGPCGNIMWLIIIRSKVCVLDI